MVHRNTCSCCFKLNNGLKDRLQHTWDGMLITNHIIIIWPNCIAIPFSTDYNDTCRSLPRRCCNANLAIPQHLFKYSQGNGWQKYSMKPQNLLNNHSLSEGPYALLDLDRCRACLRMNHVATITNNNPTITPTAMPAF